jgi:hypothetical protein
MAVWKTPRPVNTIIARHLLSRSYSHRGLALTYTNYRIGAAASKSSSGAVGQTIDPISQLANQR